MENIIQTAAGDANKINAPIDLATLALSICRREYSKEKAFAQNSQIPTKAFTEKTAPAMAEDDANLF